MNVNAGSNNTKNNNNNNNNNKQTIVNDALNIAMVYAKEKYKNKRVNVTNWWKRSGIVFQKWKKRKSKKKINKWKN